MPLLLSQNLNQNLSACACLPLCAAPGRTTWRRMRRQGRPVWRRQVRRRRRQHAGRPARACEGAADPARPPSGCTAPPPACAPMTLSYTSLEFAALTSITTKSDTLPHSFRTGSLQASHVAGLQMSKAQPVFHQSNVGTANQGCYRRAGARLSCSISRDHLYLYLLNLLAACTAFTYEPSHSYVNAMQAARGIRR